MRGDSLRDLYAKTLAVIGLGILAGAGALVDYWPAGIHYPAVASTFSPAPLLPSSLVLTPAYASASPQGEVSRVAAREQAVARVPALAGLSVYQAGLPLGEPLELRLSQRVVDTPEPVAVVARALELADAPRALDTSQSAVEVWSPAAPTDALANEPTSVAADGGRGFVSGALSKTTTSIVRTGRWTGASLASAARVVRGVVSRAIPN